MSNKKIFELEDSLEKDYQLITEAISDVIFIAKNNDEEIAIKLIKEQFLVIDRQDIE